MVKRILFLAAPLVAAFVSFFAHAVDVNAADEAALRAIKGIGPAKARAIVEERATGGPFMDAGDLSRRVKGMGGQTVERLRAEGLTVGSQTQWERATESFASTGRGTETAGGARRDRIDADPVSIKR
jgi:competence protein ComEA